MVELVKTVLSENISLKQVLLENGVTPEDIRKVAELGVIDKRVIEEINKHG